MNHIQRDLIRALDLISTSQKQEWLLRAGEQLKTERIADKLCVIDARAITEKRHD